MVFTWLRRRKLRKQPLPAAWVEILDQNAPFVRKLEPPLRARFDGDLQIFVGERTFMGAGGLEVTDEHRVTIGAAATRLTLHLDISAYDELTEIIVYPGAYKHAGKDDVAVLGEAHQWGVVALSWEAVVTGMRNPRDGHDTAVHEFAHVLDRGTAGAFDGTPELRAHDHYRPWAGVMSAHYLRLKKKDQKLRTVLRDYGATNEAEFFAVATEVYFERPEELRTRAPDLYEELRRFFGPH